MGGIELLASERENNEVEKMKGVGCKYVGRNFICECWSSTNLSNIA